LLGGCSHRTQNRNYVTNFLPSTICSNITVEGENIFNQGFSKFLEEEIDSWLND